MRVSLLTSLAALVGLCPAAVAQPADVYAIPNPPDTAALSRLNLKTEWAINLPMLGRQDAVDLVQILDTEQFVVQTRSGLVAMMDAQSGAKQWSFQLPAPYGNTFLAGYNNKYVLVLNVTKLFCFDRYTGLLAFELELPSPPTMGPMADRDFVYVTTEGNRLSCYRIPEGAVTGGIGSSEDRNLANVITTRAGGYYQAKLKPESDPTYYNPVPPSGTYANLNQKTPSVAALPSVVPPYNLDKRRLLATPAVSLVPSLRQPYQFRPPHLTYNQITPSVAVIPPSIYRVHELANFRPKAIQPDLIWSYLMPGRVGSVPLRAVAYPEGANNPAPANWFTDRLWLGSDSSLVLAISGKDGTEQVGVRLRDRVTTPFGGPLMFDRSGRNTFAHPEDLTALGFLGLEDGSFVAVDLAAGGRDSQQAGPARVEWKTNLGSPASNKPLVTSTAVYASGKNAGVTKLNAQTGEELWETEAFADHLLGVNEEYAYVMDHTGNLRIYDNNAVIRNRAPATPLAKIEIPGFNVPVSNDKSDRIFLVSHTGMMICLRDASGKYTRPWKLSPPGPQKYAPKPPAPMAADQP